MSSKTKQSTDPNRRLYPKRSNITRTEKRTNPNAQNQKIKTTNRNVNKDLKNPLTKQDLIKQYIDLLDQLQNLQKQLEVAQKSNKNLKKQLKNLEGQNANDSEPPVQQNRRSNSKYVDQDEDIDDYSDQNYDQAYDQNYDQNYDQDEGYEEESVDQYEDGEEDY